MSTRMTGTRMMGTRMTGTVVTLAALAAAAALAACASVRTPQSLRDAEGIYRTLVNAGAEQRVEGPMIRAQRAIDAANGAVAAKESQEYVDAMAHIALRTAQTAEAEDARVLAQREADSLSTARMRRLLAMSESQRRQLEKQQQASEEENAALRRRNEEIAQRADSLRREAEAANARLNEALARLKSLVSEITNLRETTRGLVVSLSDVLFDFNRATLRPGAEAKIGQIATILKQYPDHKISVEGHTDSIGSNAYNQRLSEQRAAAVAKALVAGGVEASMISSRGFGRTQPVASNKTAEGRQQNRRVEIVVLGAGTLADAERARADSVARARSGGKPAAGADSSTRRPPE